MYPAVQAVIKSALLAAHLCLMLAYASVIGCCVLQYNDTKTNCVERVADCKHALIVLRSHLGPVEERLRQQGDKLKVRAMLDTAAML
jgi:hypothetical protein